MMSTVVKRWFEHCKMAAEFAHQEEKRGSLPRFSARERSNANSLAELGALVVGERAIAG
jgi:hypothetical protein